MICSRLIFAASRGFAADITNLGAIMSRIANEGRSQYHTGFPPDDVIRSFRERNREITYRRSENKYAAKPKADSYEHVNTYVKVRKEMDKDFTDILKDPDRIRNMDETAVSAEFGKKVKTFVSSTTNHG